MTLNNVLRFTTTGLLAATLIFSLSSSDAAAKKKKGDDASADAPAEALSIVETGVADVDGVFMPIKGIHDQLTGAEERLRNAETNIRTALGVASDAPLATALADFKAQAADSITFAMDGTTPKLSVSDAAPENIKTGVAAIQSAFTDLQTVITELPALKDQAMEAVNAAKGMDFKALATSAGLGAKDILPFVKTAGANLKATTQTPDRITGTVNAATSLMGTLTEPFKG
jgi:hypothetical protein